MRCPLCAYQSPFDVVHCPQCEGSFAADELEELGHVAYLRTWIEDERDEGILPADLTARLTIDVDRRRSIIERSLGMAAPAPAAVAATVPLAAVVLAPAPLATAPVPAIVEAPPPTMPPPPAAPARPAFSWTEAGTYLLSERTLHALLGLGALLILASGVVISTLNPTGLGPALHLAAVVGTTLLFYAAGYVVGQRLRLSLTGAALLGIGGAFVPLTVWTLGQEVLHWESGAIWLLASLLCLPLYLGSHGLLRDRTFAVLVGVAGGSLLLALLNWIGAPLEWGLALIVGLAVGYVWLSGRLPPEWRTLSWALALGAQVTVPVVMVALLGAKFFPAAWEVAARQPLGGWYEYAVGLAWWLGAAFFAYAALRLHRSYLRIVAVWAVPVAYLLTLTKAPWDAAWHSVALAALAGAYVLYGHRRLSQASRTYRSAAREAVYQAAFVLTLLAAVWRSPTLDSRIVTLLVLALVYGSAAILLQQRAWAYVAVYLLPISYALLLERTGTDAQLRPLLWAGVTAALLGAAELEVRRTGEARRRLVPTILGRDQWTSLFASPLFSVGYFVGLATLWLAWTRYWNAPAVTGVRQLDSPTIVAFLALVGISALSAVARRTSGFLYLASWLFLIPFTAAAGRFFAAQGLPLPEAELARLLALLGIVYLVVAYATQGVGERYARPMHLVGYVLALATMLMSALDRALNVQVVGISILVFAASAWLVHTRRHLAYAALVRRLFGDPNASAARHADSLFVYLACWLFPAWLLLSMSLRSPAPAVADYGLALTLLASVYAALGLGARRIRSEYRWPWYLAAYALSVIGPLVTIVDDNYRLLALAISIGLYVASAIVSRYSAWLSPVALLTPVLVWQSAERAGVPARFGGLVLIVLALVYGCAGVILHHGVRHPRSFREPIGAAIGPYARPFFLIGYALCALGLALIASQDRELVVAAFVLAGGLFAGSAYLFRQALFCYPLTATLAVAYVIGLTLTALDWRYYGLGLVPGMLAALAVADLLRRRLDTDVEAPSTPRRILESWSTPFFLLTYLGTAAVPAWSTAEQAIWAAAWCAVASIYGISVVLFRRPAWLYPPLAAALVAYAATLYAVVSNLTPSDALAALAAPGVLLFGSAFTLAYRQSQTESPSLERLIATDRLFKPRWADPLALIGWVALLLAVVGGAADPAAGLRAGAAAALTFALLATFWRGRAEACAGLLAGGVVLEEALRLAETPVIDQPPRWALAALVLSLLAIGLRWRGWPVLQVWPRPLSVTALATGAAAILWALGLQLIFREHQTLQPLSATMALTGLTLVAHGFDRRERLLVYQGVALLELGYMLQLLFFDVGQPQAFVIPAGAYLLAIAYLEWRRGTDIRVKGALELAGMTMLLGVSLLQAVGFLGDGLDRHFYATFLLLESVAVFGLGAVLHWRRPFVAGMLALVLDVAILLADPLRALNTWYLAALIGLAMIAAVVFIEQRRRQIPFWLDEWRRRLDAWQ